MHYIVDGYNLFFSIEDELNPFKEKRQDFIAILNEMLEKFHFHVSLIFDSHYTNASTFPSKQELSSLAVIFSPQGLSADEYILEQLRTKKNPNQYIVVTSDRELMQKANNLGAQTKTIKNFLQILTRHKTKQKPSEEKMHQESPYHHNRLLKIFEKKLQDESLD